MNILWAWLERQVRILLVAPLDRVALGYINESGRGLTGLQKSRRDRLRLPIMGGNEMIEALRERDADLPVIVMTGYPPDGVGGAKMPQGGTARLNKPFELDALSAALDATVNRNGR